MKSFSDVAFMDVPFKSFSDVAFMDVPFKSFSDAAFKDVPFMDVPFKDVPFKSFGDAAFMEYCLYPSLHTYHCSKLLLRMCSINVSLILFWEGPHHRHSNDKKVFSAASSCSESKQNAGDVCVRCLVPYG